ncbi:MAG: hypothetical protein ACO3DS_10175 [Phycisphaerales bacterium]
MSFPVDDWQFWAVTACALVGAWFVLRPILPRTLKPRAKARPTRARLTSGGKPPDAPLP